MTPIEGPEAGLNAAVAAELRAERAAQNLTVQQLAEKSEVPYATLRRYLAAERHIDVATIAALAEALDTTAVELVMAATERLQRGSGANVIAGDFGNSSDDASNLDHLRGLPSAAAPKRRDTGQGDDDA
jgi:transcriptional regulator with XRE-family HTH domain